MSDFITDVMKHNGFSKRRKKEWESHLKKPEDVVLSFPDFDQKKDIQEFFVNRDLRIMISADYDSDGITGAAVLYKYLKAAGFRVFPYLPKRIDGYGMNQNAIQEYKKKYNIDTIITVDCGISNKEIIDFAKALGINTIITDHHSVPPEIPEAKFILHPEVTQGIEEMKDFSGSGMAFFLCWIVEEKLQTGFDLLEWSAIAAMGTIGDMTALRGLNRDFVKYGIHKAKSTSIIGLNALQLASGCNLEYFNESDLAFSIIPKINAAGRLDSPIPSFAVLVTDQIDGSRGAIEWAHRLNEFNKTRKEISKQYAEAAIEVADPNDPVVVVFGEFIHGIIGVTAADVVSETGKPAFILAKEGDFYRGSARAPEWFNVLDALKYVAGFFDYKFGGHKAAAGFSVPEKKIMLFKNLLNEFMYQQEIKSLDQTEAYMKWKDEYLQENLAQSLIDLQPFGQGFKKPIFKEHLDLEFKRMSQDGNHFFGKAKGMDVSGFFMSPEGINLDGKTEVLYSLDIDTYKRKKPKTCIRLERFI